MNAKWEELFPFFKAITEENGFILLILLVPACIYGVLHPRKLKPQETLFLFFLGTALIWRMLYSMSMVAGSRYNQYPVVLLTVLGMPGIAGFHHLFSRFRWGSWLTAGVVILVVGIGIGKSLHQPKEKIFIAEVVKVLNTQPTGLLLDFSEGQSRLKKMLPQWECIGGGKYYCNQAAFWNTFFRFVIQRQGEGKNLYVLLRQPEDMLMTAFRDSCRREWGFEPFQEIWRKTERRQNYILLKFVPPATLLGLPLITKTNPNPYGLRLPETISVSNAGKFTLFFDSILQDNPFSQWGGVELFARAGKCYDDRWELEIKADTPRKIPVSVTLFLPNGWPVGYAQSTVQLVNAETDKLPSIVQRRSQVKMDDLPPYWHALLPRPRQILAEKDTPLLWRQMANIPGAAAAPLPVKKVAETTGKLTGTLFWIGSRCNGTKWLTDQLQKRNPALKILRLEEHPVLPYSKDPRYSFLDLSALRHNPNPLIYDGKADWKHYCTQENVPPDAVIVIALGYEEVMYQGWQKAFHIDDALKSLQNFLDNVTNNTPQTKILLIAPNLPADQDVTWTNLSSNPYLYGFRWNKRHVYRRLLEGLTAVEKQYRQVTLLPSYLFVPAGKEERHPEYLPAIERYLYQITDENGKNNENSVHP